MTAYETQESETCHTVIA